MESIFFAVNAVTITSLFLAVIYTAGVVWRVEMKLDVSYKFFLAAVVFLLVAEILSLYYPADKAALAELAVKSLRMLFALGFLSGVLFMRNAMRSLDGEIK